MTSDDPRSARDAELVQELDWVQRLAHSLARNRDAADDLAQDVARVWLEKRPVNSVSPRGWLASVARKLALDRKRSEAARAARERAVARPEREEYEIVERLARQRRVAQAVSELDEPYRSTILYRFLDGLSTSAVAERMHTNEPTVRKRIERGLALLRERLGREFGSTSNAWALALLEPALRASLLKGAGIMSVKWIATAAAAVLVAGVAWYAVGGFAADARVEVGGRGEVVPLEIAAAREKPVPPPPSTLESAEEAPRAVVPTVPAPASGAPRLQGFLFLDEQRGAPKDLEITRMADETRADSKATVDAASASWSLEPLGGKPGVLWITSASTIPAQIPVPPELWASGGTFDLHLSSGRTLVLTLIDKETKQPLPDLAFEVYRSVEVERTRGRASMNGVASEHRTDARGMATIAGVPLVGSITVSVDFERRTREVVMRGGKVMRMSMSRDPDWEMWFKEALPMRIEQTIPVTPPQGEACASGQVPPWAIALAGGRESVRVAARETTRESKQRGAMSFLLPTDDQGHFELCASAPSTQAVWLERAGTRERLSAESELAFARPGAQDPIGFRELAGNKVTLRFVDVPDHGELQAWIVGGSTSAPSQDFACKGAPFAHEFTLGEGEQIQLSLRRTSEQKDKSGWTRLVQIQGEHELTIDLGGCERLVRLEAAEIELRERDGAVIFLRCENGEASIDQSTIVLCNAGRALAPVHIPNGRWLYRYDDKSQLGVWGLVEVTSGAQPGEELVLRPRLRLAPVAELDPGLRFDEIEGVSLAKLPEKFRIVSAKGLTGTIALPLNAKSSTLPAK